MRALDVEKSAHGCCRKDAAQRQASKGCQLSQVDRGRRRNARERVELGSGRYCRVCGFARVVEKQAFVATDLLCLPATSRDLAGADVVWDGVCQNGWSRDEKERKKTWL